MKASLLTCVLALATAVAARAQTPRPAALPAGVVAVEVEGKSYYATPNGPDFVAGHYLYEGKDEPIVDLSRDHQSGAFQRHQVPATPLTWWGFECDATGKLWEAHNDATGRHFHTLVVRYGGSASYPAPGSYDRLLLSFDASKVYILGEREKAR